MYSDSNDRTPLDAFNAAEEAYNETFAGDARMLKDNASRYLFIKGYLNA